MIKVEQMDEGKYKVRVEQKTTTFHTVNADSEYVEKLTGGKASTEELIHKCFEFLLEKEPNTSILRSFDLPVISRYFPEFEETIIKQLQR
ncbi:MAG: hypothetical protein V5B78_10735 [Desulfohalobiaceae bacterium]